MEKKNELKGILLMLGGMLSILGIGSVVMSFMEIKESSNSNGYIQSSTNSSNYSNSSSDYSYSNSSTITLNDIKRNMSNTNKEIVGSNRLPNGDVGLTYIDGNRGGVYTSIISTDSNGNSVIVKTYRENF